MSYFSITGLDWREALCYNHRYRMETTGMAVTQSRELIEQIKTIGLDVDKERIQDACHFMIKAHERQYRASGDPYFLHPLAVASIIVDLKLDTASIITALLHDTVEDTPVTLEDISKRYGADIAKLVDGVTKLTKIEFQPDHIRQAENFRKLLLAISEDIRVLLVKLADRLHNMRTIGFVKSEEKRMRLAHETMEIYAPLAERLGVQRIKTELQDLSFAELHADARNSITHRLEFLRAKGSMVIDRIEEQFRAILKAGGVHAIVTGREKTPYSIWLKMERKNISFEQLSDVIGFRVMVNSQSECYLALGIIHMHYAMVPGSYKDFISTPKENAYQSLHTIVMGPEQQRVEIQIRTHEMHEIAQMGVAAHWTYKQRHEESTEGKRFQWVQELLSILEQSTDPEELLENTKLEMSYDQVFCFTPQGKLIALPRNATPVDFAYILHSKIGSTCVGAKVNGRVVPLQTKLQNGDQVEIICSKDQSPSPAWEKFVVTGKARSEIKRFIRGQQHEEYRRLGQAILEKSLRHENIPNEQEVLDPLLVIFRKKSMEELYVALGEGTISRGEIMRVVLKKTKKRTAFQDTLDFFKKRSKSPSDDALPIKGLIPGMAVHLASCCHPLPGDRIIGIMQMGKGIMIHVGDCAVLETVSDSPDQWIEVSWDSRANNQLHVAQIRIMMAHEVGSLAAVATCIAQERGNISNIKILSRSSDFFEIALDIEVKGTKHLSDILTSLRSYPNVHAVNRMRM